MKKDYYEILGVSREAAAQEIKKKYRSLALKYHPDRVKERDKKTSEEKFKEISEAYGVLSDPQKRKMYDQYGHSGIDQRYTAEDIFGGADFSSIFGDAGGLGDIFSQFFGGGSSSGGGFGGGSRGRRGRDIQYEVEITLEEAYSGMKKKIKVPRNEHCNDCRGSGAKNGTALKTCPACQGQGQVMVSSGFFRMAQTCSACSGRGKTITENCPKCNGKGDVRVTRNIDINIPAGVSSESRLRVRGEGEIGSAGPGDLYLYIFVKRHDLFERADDDLQMQLPISFIKAALGGEISIPTLDGNVTMKIPAGTQSGKVFRLKGKGMPDVRSGTKGNLYVRSMLSVPTNLSSEQKKLLEDFAAISEEDISTEAESFTDKIKKVFK